MSGGNVGSGSFAQLRTSTNRTGLRWSNTNLPNSTIITSPFQSVTSLTNINNVDALVEVKFNFGDSYMFMADGDLRVRIYGQILKNGLLVDDLGIAHYNWLDSEPFNNTQQQTEMRPNGSAFNDTVIIASPNDIIEARQYITAQSIGGGNGTERIYWYNSQTVISMIPQTVAV